MCSADFRVGAGWRIKMPRFGLLFRPAVCWLLDIYGFVLLSCGAVTMSVFHFLIAASLTSSLLQFQSLRLIFNLFSDLYGALLLPLHLSWA